MQHIQTHARGAKFSTYYNPPNHPQSSSSCGRHDQHKHHSILPDHHTNQLQMHTDCTARSLFLSLSVSLSCLQQALHFIVLLQTSSSSSCNSSSSCSSSCNFSCCCSFFFQQLLFFLFFFLFLFFFFLQLLILFFFFFFFSCYNQEGILQSKAKQSKASKLQVQQMPKQEKKQKDKSPVTKCVPHKCMHGNTNCWLAG